MAYSTYAWVPVYIMLGSLFLAGGLLSLFVATFYQIRGEV